jgi:hypothetical protein
MVTDTTQDAGIRRSIIQSVESMDLILPILVKTADGTYRTFGSIDTIYKSACNMLSEKFETGLGLRSTKLKNHSGGNLEDWSKLVIEIIIVDLKERYPNADIEWGKSYIVSDFEGNSNERLDQHVKVNGKYAYLQEDRAWMDKPFYTLKRAVIRNMMISCASKMSENVKFGVVAFCIDIKQGIINTCNMCQGYGDRIEMFAVTGRGRNKKVNGEEVNWYETGYIENTVLKYIQYVYKTLEDAILEEI